MPVDDKMLVGPRVRFFASLVRSLYSLAACAATPAGISANQRVEHASKLPPRIYQSRGLHISSACNCAEHDIRGERAEQSYHGWIHWPWKSKQERSAGIPKE
jgi:hypothetical protein